MFTNIGNIICIFLLFALTFYMQFLGSDYISWFVDHDNSNKTSNPERSTDHWIWDSKREFNDNAGCMKQ